MSPPKAILSPTILFLGLGFSFGIVCTLLAFSLFGSHKSPAPTPRPFVVKGQIESTPSWDDPQADQARENIPPFIQHPVAFEPVVDDLRSTPIPLEWENSLFAVLEIEDMDRRNSGLIQLATVTARDVPRVQAECLAHLTYGLDEKDYAQFLTLIRNPALPLESKMQFLEETLKIRRPEFSDWLAKNLVNDPQPKISEAARRFLAEARVDATHSEKETNGPF